MDKQFPNIEWNLADDKGNVGTWEKVAIAVLMDIRRELKTIRILAQCPNVAKGFIAMQQMNSRDRRKQAKRKRVTT